MDTALSKATFGRRRNFQPSEQRATPAPSFLEQCRPKLLKLEEVRLEKLKAFSWRKKMAIPIGAVMTPILGSIDYWLFMLQRGNEDSIAGLSIAGLGGLWLWVTSPKRQYAKAYKTDMLPDIARLFGLSLIHI